MGRFARGALLGLLAALATGVWPAHADPSATKVTGPAQDEVLAGHYATDGSAAGFVVSQKGSATTTCSKGFSSVKFTITGPSSYSHSASVTPPTKNGTFSFSANWDTQDLDNGVYTVKLSVTDVNNGLWVNCGGKAATAAVTAKLANPGHTPVWDGSPTPATDGSASVSLSWKKNPETDVLEYRILRSGPGGDVEAVVDALKPETQGCSLANGSYTCGDTSFPSPADGTYTYSVTAWRFRPAYNSGESAKPTCTPDDVPCVSSAASDVRQVTIAGPSPSPSPSQSSSSPTPKATKSASGGKKGTGGGLSFGGSSRPRVNQFYTGTYSPSLPYQPPSIVGGGGTTPSGSGARVEAAPVTGSPPNYRTVMLPVAGGLLGLLSAAHVRRLLVRF